MNTKIGTLALLVSTALLNACSDSDNSSSDVQDVTPSGESSFTTVNLDASAGGFSAEPDSPENKAVYFNFDSGETVDLSDDEALLSDAWHIAFKRTNTYFNGGSAGIGNVSSALLDAQSDYYDDQGVADNNVFLNTSAEAELTSFNDATVSDQNFAVDTAKPAIVSDGSESSWWSYNSTTHALSAEPNNWSIIRSATGDSYAKIHVTALDTTARSISVEMYVQAQSQSSFSDSSITWQADIGSTGGALCFDIDSDAEVDCEAQAESWDLRAEISADARSWTLWTNGGAYGDGSAGASLPELDSSTVATYAGASEVPGFFEDSVSNAVKDNSWYAYNLQSQHKLWPNYRVYGVDTGTEIYKFQVIGYYDEAGNSGFISMRYSPLNAE